MDEVEGWIVGHCYDSDDIVLGDRGLTEEQLPAMKELLDIVSPGWRELFE